MAVILFGATVTGVAQSVDFDGDAVGSPPKGWTLTMTGSGMPKWTVERDETAPSKDQVLKQSGTATYPLAFKDGTSIKDGFVEVRVKPLSGSEDRAAGLVWRAKDANNYYVVRANALEDNVVLYKTVNGARSSLDIVGRKGGYGVKIAVHSGHTTKLGRSSSGTLARRRPPGFNTRAISARPAVKSSGNRCSSVSVQITRSHDAASRPVAPIEPT